MNTHSNTLFIYTLSIHTRNTLSHTHSKFTLSIQIHSNTRLLNTLKYTLEYNEKLNSRFALEHTNNVHPLYTQDPSSITAFLSHNCSLLKSYIPRHNHHHEHELPPRICGIIHLKSHRFSFTGARTIILAARAILYRTESTASDGCAKLTPSE